MLVIATESLVDTMVLSFLVLSNVAGAVDIIKNHCFPDLA